MLLPPPVGEVAQDAQADCDGEGNRQAQRHKEHIRTRNVPNEINDFNGFTVPPEKHEINDFNEIMISRPPNGITKATKPTKTTKCLFCGHFVFFVVYGEIVISLQPLALDKKRAALYTGKEKNGPPRAGRKCDALCRKPKTPSKPSSTR